MGKKANNVITAAEAELQRRGIDVPPEGQETAAWDRGKHRAGWARWRRSGLWTAATHSGTDSRAKRCQHDAQGTRATGVKRNRKRLFLVRADIVAVSRLEDVVDE